MSAKTRSPIKGKPLRLPGQSLRRERQMLWEDKIEPWALLAIFFMALALFEWFRHWQQLPPSPWLMSVAAALALGLAVWRYWRLRPQLNRLRQGIDGEVVVGQFLERLREQGYHVFHDVVAEGFNIDHVLIGPAGVFTIETKTWSKPTQGDARIRYDGTLLLVNGQEPERNAIAQAEGQGRWLRNMLRESTGRDLAVRPVVVFPGWFVEATAGAQRTVWVMEPKGLPAFLANAPLCHAAEDVKLAAYHLGRYVRSANDG